MLAGGFLGGVDESRGGSYSGGAESGGIGAERITHDLVAGFGRRSAEGVYIRDWLGAGMMWEDGSRWGWSTTWVITIKA